MKKIYFLFLSILISSCLTAQDTFSIVAIDTITGEVGSAGASCIDDTQIQGGALIISDVIPGRGGIHTQAYWNTVNQQHAHARMMEGMSPQEIIDWLVANDAQNNPNIRQYGIVDFDSVGHPRSAAYTGINCQNYKNHITGPNYSIQGNILLGQQILDSMQSRFMNTQGMLAEKLMAALQGAKVPGADTRCTAEGVSSLSAFIRVARTTDTVGGFYLDLNVPILPYGMEPIDSLQTLFNEWLNQIVGVEESLSNDLGFTVYPNPVNEMLNVDCPTLSNNKNQVIIFTDLTGRMVKKLNVSNYKMKVDISDLKDGIYFVAFEEAGKPAVVRKIVKRGE
jgi:uncharacterized Ntn-hydrolase superfamily protein